MLRCALFSRAALSAAGISTGLIAGGGAAGITFTDAVATGVVAALGDAAVQGVAIEAGIQNRFSGAEVIETGVTAGVGVTLGSAKRTSDVAKNAFKITAAAVGTQLIEMSLGIRDKFDARAVALQTSAALVSMGINSVVQAKMGNSFQARVVNNAATSTSNALLGAGVKHTPISIANIAAETVGSTVSNEVSKGILRGTIEDNKFNAELAQAEEVAHMEVPKATLSLPAPKYGDVSYQLSEINSTRMQYDAEIGRYMAQQVGTKNATFSEMAAAYIEGAAEAAVKGPIILAHQMITDPINTINALRPSEIAKSIYKNAPGFFNKLKNANSIGKAQLLGETLGAAPLGGLGFFGKIRALNRFEKIGAESVIQGATKHPLAGLSAENVVRLADELGLATKRDELILWSGLGRNNAGVKLSQEFARANGGITLELTPGGRWLEEMDLYASNSPFTRAEVGRIWEQASTKMIQQASGQVRSLVGQVKPTAVYRAEQSEILMNNKILGLDELNLKPRFIFVNN